MYNSSMKNLPEVLTVTEVADYLRVSKATVNRRIRDGLIDCFRVGPRGDRRIKKSELRKFIGRYNNG